MAPFYPLYVRRSDGKLEIFVRGKRKELNQPTDDQLDQKPDKDGVSDFYREVSVDEPKHLDWRRKLGGMLARELDWKDPSGNDFGHILVTFPEGYRLYEHVKRTEKDGKLEVKSKTHAAGGNDRQDAYLYGHPAGRRKRFRSPADFFPHLLWLCTDESGDPDNCTCKLCCPEELESLMAGTRIAADKPAKTETETKSTLNASDGQIQPSLIPPSVPKVSSDDPGLSATPVSHPASHAHLSTTPSGLPPRQTQEQYIDGQYNGFLYRAGELVWFARGQRWGLGVILRRWLSAPGQPHYTVQPLSHPFSHPSPVLKDSDTQMRPWLAWSVPKYTIDGLNSQAQPPRYDTADWQGLMNKRYGSGDLEVDASILAAKAIDSSYTLIDQLDISEPEPGLVETRYGGIYLGAEKIWVRDPVRLQIGSGTDIMVVSAILERKRISPINQQIVQHSVHFIGDVYYLSSIAHADPNVPSPAAPSKNPHLPTRLTEDLAFRNARSIRTERRASFWRFMTKQARIDINDVKGRWYEASRLLPILLSHESWEEAKLKGDIQETSLWMNSRGDCINNNRDPALPRLPLENVRRDTRRDAFGRAVPPNTEVHSGIDPPNVDPALEGMIGDNENNDNVNIDPRFETAEAADTQPNESVPSHLSNNDGAIDDFMNLDSINDHSQMPDYGGQSGFY